MLLDILDLAPKDPESSLRDIIFSGAERLLKVKPGLDAVQFKRKDSQKRKDNQNNGFACFASGYNSFKSWNSGLARQRREAAKLEAASNQSLMWPLLVQITLLIAFSNLYRSLVKGRQMMDLTMSQRVLAILDVG